LAKFGLELHPEKTRLIEFGRFAAPNRQRWGKGKPETFTFLGFTHYCGKRRKDGAFIVWRETAKKRLVAKLQAIKLELKRLRHAPIARVGEWLRKVITGYYQYHAVPGNLPRLQLFRWRLRWVWWRALSRRGQRRRVPLGRLTRLTSGPMDSSSPCSASLSYGALRRQSSKVEAVCLSRAVRFCAGGAG
jgi:RNA-directed DNA polymerase